MVFVWKFIWLINWKDCWSQTRVLLKLKQAKTTRNNAKAILELQENAGLRMKSGNGKGKGKNRDKNKSTPKANGPKDCNGYYLCGNCGKYIRVSIASLFQELRLIKILLHKLNGWLRKLLETTSKLWLRLNPRKRSQKERVKDVIVAAAVVQNHQRVKMNHGRAVCLEQSKCIC